jgi:membrane protease YdiL (CAAX protease family)
LSTPANPQPSTSTDAIAPAWHTVVIVLIMAAISGWSAYSGGLPSVGHARDRIASYVSAIVMEWLVFGFIWFGLRLRNQRLRILLGENWGGARQILRDLGLALLFLIVANIILTVLGHLLTAEPNAAIRNLLPHGPAQIAVYLLLTVTAGICEEIIFRGYLQRQFSAWFKSATVAVVLQGVIFGASHGYQGPKLMLIIVVYGVMFGMLAQWRHSLRPGIISHFLQDFIGGVVGGRFMK